MQTTQRLFVLALAWVVLLVGTVTGCTMSGSEEKTASFQAWNTDEMLRPIIGPVYRTSTTVRVESVQADTKVQLYSGTQLLAEEPGKSGSVNMALNRALHAGEKLHARVLWNGTPSERSEQVEVLPVPNHRPAPEVFPVQYVGGECIQVKGAVDGDKALAVNGSEHLAVVS
ncbi:MAG: hypothetical protein ACOC1F_10050 [Myxococcota bacterium]